MRLSDSRSALPAPLLRSPRFRHRGGSRAWSRLAAIALVCCAGCVTRGAYEEVRVDRDRLSAESRDLSEKVRLLELSNENLNAERAKLMDETEDLVQIRGTLERDVSRLRSTEAELAKNLTETTARLQKQEEEVSRLKGTYAGLVQDLESEVASGQIEIEQLREGLRLNVSDEILFPPGSAQLANEGIAVLNKVALQLLELDQRIEIQGHSDNIPIRGSLTKRYPTNWELAAARASRVVRLFQTRGVSGSRLSAVSFAEFRPVAPNDDPEQRSLNRRIEIRLLPPDGGAATGP